MKKLLIEKGDLNILNNKNETPYDYSIKFNLEKIKNIFDEYLNENRNKVCIIKPGLRKPEKSSFNLFFFIFIHLFLESIIFFFILPCKIIILRFNFLIINLNIH